MRPVARARSSQSTAAAGRQYQPDLRGQSRPRVPGRRRCAEGHRKPHRQGLNRSLLMAPFLQQDVLGNNNVTAIYALEPMTHLQTVNGYPDMAALETIQQFDMLNQITTTSGGPGTTATPGQNFPINVSYALGSVPTGVAMPSPRSPARIVRESTSTIWMATTKPFSPALSTRMSPATTSFRRHGNRPAPCWRSSTPSGTMAWRSLPVIRAPT